MKLSLVILFFIRGVWEDAIFFMHSVSAVIHCLSFSYRKRQLDILRDCSTRIFKLEVRPLATALWIGNFPTCRWLLSIFKISFAITALRFSAITFFQKSKWQFPHQLRERGRQATHGNAEHTSNLHSGCLYVHRASFHTEVPYDYANERHLWLLCTNRLATVLGQLFMFVHHGIPFPFSLFFIFLLFDRTLRERNIPPKSFEKWLWNCLPFHRGPSPSPRPLPPPSSNPITLFLFLLWYPFMFISF